MKLDHCKQHAGSDDDSLNCYRIRHDDGRPASDYEVMSRIDAQAAEIERLAEYNQTRTDELSASVAQCVGQHTEIERLRGLCNALQNTDAAEARDREIAALRADAGRYIPLLTDALKVLKAHQEYGSPTLLTGVMAVNAIRAIEAVLKGQP